MILKYFGLAYDAFLGGDQEKSLARYEFLRFVARKCGFRMYLRNLWWYRDEQYLKVWQGFPQANNYIHERHYTLYSLAKSVCNIPGDTVECGVYYGAGSYLILKAGNGGLKKQHHIFDSFEGLSDPETIDEPEESRVESWNKNDLSVPEDIVRQNLSEFDNVSYYKGWIPTRFESVEDKRFSFVHVDVDLYQPTLDCIAFFYERLEKGGMLVCDDYGSEQCPGAFRAFNEFMEDKPENIVNLTTGTGFVVKQ